MVEEGKSGKDGTALPFIITTSTGLIAAVLDSVFIQN